MQTLNTFRTRFAVAISLMVIAVWYCCLPSKLFEDPTSTVVNSSDGRLLGARIAKDGQWRFPEIDSIPERFEKCILYFEDEYFYHHPGFNPISIFNAIRHNLTQESRRGASTITQQLIRLSRKNRNRTYVEKAVEVFMATRLEFRHSKEVLLGMYVSHTPFGGNIVGLEAAAWRYFGIPADQLSWGQSATLAVLPNAPSLIFPGKNQKRLIDKRNRLLKKLRDKDVIDELTYGLAIEEPLPQHTLPLPNMAPHLVERANKEFSGKMITSSIDRQLQEKLELLAKNHYKRLKGNQIHNLAILVLDVKTKKVMGYVGNSPSTKDHSNHVDIITRKRSAGSTLKPLLYAQMLSDGDLLPKSIVKDIPTVINGYKPKNFNLKFQGLVPAGDALAKSLNVPAVRLLQEYGLDKFHNKLKSMNMATIDRPADHYGLSLILGGAECSLWDITKTYASLAATLNHFNANSSQYFDRAFAEPTYLNDLEIDFGKTQFNAPIVNAGSIYHTMNALKDANRSDGNENWEYFTTSQPIAWKTGTSYGFKDAWAVGVTPKYAIGIWAGNADGEGRPGLTGLSAAAPLLFDVLDLLPSSGWFEAPLDDLVELETCNLSGFRASAFCDRTQMDMVPTAGKKTIACPYHQQIALDQSLTYQVSSECYDLEDMVFKNYLVLPPVMSHYYAEANPNFKPLPPYHPECNPENGKLMDFIHPRFNEEVLIPRSLGEAQKESVFKLAHRQEDKSVHWYLDEDYLGTTQNFHELLVSVKSGDYTLTAVDEDGNRLQQPFRVRMANE